MEWCDERLVDSLRRSATRHLQSREDRQRSVTRTASVKKDKSQPTGWDFLFQYLIECGHPTFRTHPSEGHKNQILEDFLHRVLTIELVLHDIIAESIEETSHQFIVHIATEETFVDAALDKLLEFGKMSQI